MVVISPNINRATSQRAAAFEASSPQPTVRHVSCMEREQNALHACDSGCPSPAMAGCLPVSKAHDGAGRCLQPAPPCHPPNGGHVIIYGACCLWILSAAV